MQYLIREYGDMMSLDDIVIQLGEEVVPFTASLQSLDLSENKPFLFQYPPNVLPVFLTHE